MSDPDVPDMEVIGAKAEAMLQWQKDHPDASLDELMEFSRTLDRGAGNE